MPPELKHPALKEATHVPLPRRLATSDSQHQIALIIRDGRKVAQQLSSSLADLSKTSLSSHETMSHTSRVPTSMSTALEQDFTVAGKQGDLKCPFSAAATAGTEVVPAADGQADPTPHRSTDPICAAMYEETMSQPAPGATGPASKCPIRFLDQHSPEEIAHYVETHKHDLPRSHAVCVSRYQKSEQQIRKLDAKYGNLVSMIQGLSQLHQPMLPEDAPRPQAQSDVDRASNERVENWAQAVSAGATSDPDERHTETLEGDDVLDRESHFDRPLKEVRVGESPSRPWGISVPVYDRVGRSDDGRPISPPPAPVRMPSPVRSAQTPAKPPGKCPFDHTKMAAAGNGGFPSPAMKFEHPSPREAESRPREIPHMEPRPREAPHEMPYMHMSQQPPAVSPAPPQAAFLNPSETRGANQNAPQMLFTGPVFIGYPIEQAIQFMQHFQRSQ